jgi:asparagine synthase (glutamine-hydrolysing)
VSQLFGWVPCSAQADVPPVVDAMAAALRVDEAQRIAIWERPGLGIGSIEPPALAGERGEATPAVSSDGRFFLWMCGEAYASGDAGLPLRDAAESRSASFRRALLDRWLAVGAHAVRSLDGEFQIAIWDARDRLLTLVNDRFGGLPMYWAGSSEGVAFAGGVRGVLVAPGVSAEPDVDALREAVTFGGYRLGARTNVQAVRMVEGAVVQTIGRNGRTARRYWTWTDIPAQAVGRVEDAIDELHARWRRAIARRMTDSARYGQTLSGGLDSRAILAEAAPGRAWTAITYGVSGCDDAAYAKRAADAVGAKWLFQPLYGGDWLAVRSAQIQAVDGLIDLADLMHLESLPLQRRELDVHLSGYIGDAVSGPTFAAVSNAEQVLHSLPFYGTTIGLDEAAAMRRAAALVDALGGAPARFAVFEHKLPQSTNRWTAAWRPWLRVRKPFVDYELFDFCQGLPIALRTGGRLHERWLRARYPTCFAAIPNQRTGLPALAPAWRVQLARLGRGAQNRVLPLLPPPLRPAPRIRAYHDNDRMWRRPEVVDRILAPITAKDAVCAGVFGADRIADLTARWRAAADAPAQVIGALYVFETYHAGLPAVLRDARAAARRPRVAAARS